MSKKNLKWAEHINERLAEQIKRWQINARTSKYQGLLQDV